MRHFPHCFVLRLRRARRLNEDVSFTTEHFAHHFANITVVIDDHYRGRDKGRIVSDDVHRLRLLGSLLFV